MRRSRHPFDRFAPWGQIHQGHPHATSPQPSPEAFVIPDRQVPQQVVRIDVVELPGLRITTTIMVRSG